MYIDFKKTVNVPAGFYCNGCSQVETTPNGISYCLINDWILRKAKNDKLLKTEHCLMCIREQLMKK